MNPSLEDDRKDELGALSSNMPYASNPQDMSHEDSRLGLGKSINLQEDDQSDNSENIRHNQKSYEQLMAGERPTLLPNNVKIQRRDSEEKPLMKNESFSVRIANNSEKLDDS